MAKTRPSETMLAVCAWDPAIDVPQSKLDEYYETRDMECLKWRAERRPMVFHLRPLDSLLVTSWIEPAENVVTQRVRAFRAAVVKVDDFRTDGDALTGVPFVPERWGKAAADGRVDLFDLFTNDELRSFDPDVIQEIGEVARWRSFFRPPIWPAFGLPPTSVRTLAMRTYLRAEQERRERAATPSGSGPAETPPTTP